MISLQEKLMRGFFSNVGADITGFFKRAEYVPSTNQFWAEEWSKQYHCEVKNGYLYAYNEGNQITGEKKGVIRFDLSKGLIWQLIFQSGVDPSKIHYRYEPNSGMNYIFLWIPIKGDKDSCFFSFHITKGSGRIFEIDAHNYQFIGLDEKKYHSKGYSVGGGVRDGIQNQDLIQELTGYEKVR